MRNFKDANKEKVNGDEVVLFATTIISIWF